MDRRKNLDIVRARAKPWDVVVIGGGATGSGCALDAASRGLKVLLLEGHDFGKGTSSRSTKLVHGGVRYLAQGNISLVREALEERAVLLRNAPHAVAAQEFAVPCYGAFDKVKYATGLKLYDLLAGEYPIGRSRILSRAETLDRLPGLDATGITGGILYHDGRFDDTRLLIDILSTADSRGAVVLNYAKVGRISKNSAGRIDGVEFVDTLSGEEFIAPALTVINATGAFCDPVRRLADSKANSIVTFSQGVHVVLDRGLMPSETALMIPKTSDGRVLFAIPWHGRLLVGTTDTPVPTAEMEPRALDAEIDFILETAGAYLATKPTRDDVLSVFAGVRPLVKPARSFKNTAKLSRGHTIEIDDSGLITVTGGKWTTYRRMAEDAVDQAVDLGGLAAGPCRTRELAVENSAASETGGSSAIHPLLPYTLTDVARAVRSELAATLEDVLARRTRCLFIDAKAAVEAADPVAEAIGEMLGEGEEWKKRQLAEFRRLARSYLTGDPAF